MYHLTVTADGKLVRAIGPIGASDAMKAWFAEEATGYRVDCTDETGVSITKAGLREIARHA